MAKIAPFKGVRYAAADPSDLVCPPYDVISPEERVQYHKKSPFNFVRLVLGEEFPDDDEKHNRFTRASEYLQKWLELGVMAEDGKPAIYIYEQQHSHKGDIRTITGLTLLVKLEDYENRVILPHENTLAKPKSGLAQLIKLTDANLDSVYGLYPDPEHKLDELMSKAAGRHPDVDVRDRDGVRHRLWVDSDPSDIAKIVEFMGDKQVVIADGHHRYETALAYRDEMRAQKNSGGEEAPYDYVMMTLVNVYSPDLVVFPTHRMAANLSEDDLTSLEPKLSEFFEIVPSTKKTLLEDMQKYEGKGIGIYSRGEAKIAVPKRDLSAELTGCEAARQLDLNVLHKFILDKALGIDEHKLKHEMNVTYTRSDEEAFKRVDSGEFQVAFFLNPVDVEAVLKIAQAGEKMPQKATYFYPKLLSGLVLRKIE